MLRHGHVRPGEQALDRLADEPQNQCGLTQKEGRFSYLYIFPSVPYPFFQVPFSCCKPDPSGVPYNCTLDDPVHVDKIWTGDCFTEGLHFVKGHAVYVVAVAVGIACLMVRKYVSFVKTHSTAVVSNTKSILQCIDLHDNLPTNQKYVRICLATLNFFANNRAVHTSGLSVYEIAYFSHFVSDSWHDLRRLALQADRVKRGKMKPNQSSHLS